MNYLWGPRQTGKTTLLQATYPAAVWIDLLKSEEYRRSTSAEGSVWPCPGGAGTSARLTSGIEVDFIPGPRPGPSSDQAAARRLLEPKGRRTEDGILILPAGDFAERLGAGDLF